MLKNYQYVVRGQFHEARADLFVRLLGPAPGDRLLDLGGGDGSFAARLTRRIPLQVTVADVSAENREKVLSRGFRHVLVSEDGLPFGQGEFDIVVCNSVIEHVTLPKYLCTVTVRIPHAEWKRRAREAQRAFAASVVRIAPSYFVQTPHRHFPIDAHVHLPFVQYLSHDNVCRLVAWTDRYWIKSCQGTVDWELFAPAELLELFPDAQITVERAFGLPKSIIAWKRRG